MPLRRSLLLASLAVCLHAPRLRAQDAAAASTRADETVPLWPAAPPGGTGPGGPERVSRKGAVSNVSHPRLIVYRPTRANGTGCLVVSGGGYARIERGTESIPAAQWLASQGMMAFELIYRLPGEGWDRSAPLQDGQRAMRLIRAGAARYGINPARIGALGFSAGGHLAAMTSVAPAASRYPAIDAVDAASARPDFAALIYPVITMLPPYNRTRSFRELLGADASVARMQALSPERLVSAETPPLFLAQAEDDPISPVENTVMMFQAATASHVPAALIEFPTGGHGWGMGVPGSLAAQWPGLFARWLAAGGLGGPWE